MNEVFYLARLLSSNTTWLNCNSWIELHSNGDMKEIFLSRISYRRFSRFNFRNFRCSFSLSLLYVLKQKKNSIDHGCVHLRWSSFGNIILWMTTIEKNNFIHWRWWELFFQSTKWREISKKANNFIVLTYYRLVPDSVIVLVFDLVRSFRTLQKE